MSAVWRVLGIESILLGIVLGIESIPKSWYRPGTIFLSLANNRDNATYCLQGRQQCKQITPIHVGYSLV